MMHDPQARGRGVRRFVPAPSGCNCSWQIGMFAPDRKIYPDYDDYLEKSMIAETTTFFREVLEGNLQFPARISSTRTGPCSTNDSPNTTASRESKANRFSAIVALKPGGSSRGTVDAGFDPGAHVRRHAASSGASGEVGPGVALW